MDLAGDLAGDLTGDLTGDLAGLDQTAGAATDFESGLSESQGELWTTADRFDLTTNKANGGTQSLWAGVPPAGDHCDGSGSSDQRGNECIEQADLARVYETKLAQQRVLGEQVNPFVGQLDKSALDRVQPADEHRTAGVGLTPRSAHKRKRKTTAGDFLGGR